MTLATSYTLGTVVCVLIVQRWVQFCLQTMHCLHICDCNNAQQLKAAMWIPDARLAAYWARLAGWQGKMYRELTACLVQ